MPTSSTGASRGVTGTLVSVRRAARRRLLAHVITAREEERRRLARDLADRPLRSMAAIRARLEELGARVETPVISDEIQALLRDVDEVGRALRRLSSDLSLRPDAEGLDAALERFLRTVEAETGVACVLEIELVGSIDPRIAAGCLRIAQDAVTNATLHAGATTVRVTVVGGGELMMRVEDDGCGYDPSRAMGHPARPELTAMRQHAEAIGGRLRVTTVKGVGTTVEVSVPSPATDGRAIGRR